MVCVRYTHTVLSLVHSTMYNYLVAPEAHAHTQFCSYLNFRFSRIRINYGGLPVYVCLHVCARDYMMALQRVWRAVSNISIRRTRTSYTCTSYTCTMYEVHSTRYLVHSTCTRTMYSHSLNQCLFATRRNMYDILHVHWHTRKQRHRRSYITCIVDSTLCLLCALDIIRMSTQHSMYIFLP